MTTVKKILKIIDQEYGGGIVSQGAEWEQYGRIPTGLFPFDLATGGGFPINSTSIVYGYESSLKSSIAMKAVVNAQRMYPKSKCVLIDLEASYDPDWGEMLGVDNAELIYVLPDYAEQAVDIIQAFTEASDVSLIVVDSLAAFIPTNEAESSAEKASVGGSSFIVAKLYRKLNVAFSKARREGRELTFIGLNQIRFKIGSYGDPETMSGGMSMKFGSHLTVRLFGKDIIDKKIHPVMPVFKKCRGIIKKYKVPITARAFEFDFGIIDAPSHHVIKGVVDDWKTLSTYLRDFGHLEKSKNCWVLFGQEFKTLKSIREYLKDSDSEIGLKVREDLINEALQIQAISAQEVELIEPVEVEV